MPPAPSNPVADLLAHQVAARHCPGALALVEQAGQVLAREAAGHVRPDGATAMHAGVRFRIASLTKPVVTVAALMLVDEGRLALDAPLGEYLPALRDLRLPGGAAPQRAPTVRDLMRHTSGLAYPFEIADAALRETWLGAGISAAMSGFTPASFQACVAGLPLVAEPGRAFRYGYATDVLGCIVEALDGVPLGQALQRRLFTPLGMAHTGFELQPGEAADLAEAHPEDAAWHATIPPIGRRTPGAPWIDSGGGGLISTLDDYAAFARLLADGGVAGGGRLLSEALMAEMFRNQLPTGVDGPAAYCGPGYGFGLGLAIRLDWGPAAMPSSAGEGAWSGISGPALFVQPRQRWFALMMGANMSSRMLCRLAFRREAGRL
ncbi:serine hydrolase domain-containing protein [Aquabacterium sp. OR-4]|uniref:serine hydrolase domain-containing protein n=1 Tax=Aquabacterium sp. OR-4 TaxID=2978127 RepID=UPI0028CB0F6F|nr:serine hydrolase domain-containing protein [Aquabacterium sp. OR-4]MDT7838672.1 serine hydrolase domain-containing protein [Aquabacterium sp. OR-4]